MKKLNNKEWNTIKMGVTQPIYTESSSENNELFQTLNKNKQNIFQPNYESLWNQIDVLIKGGKLIKLEKHYGEREVRQRLIDFVIKIQENPDRYWVFNSKWEFSLLSLDGKLIHKKEVLYLFRNCFSEYYKPNMKRALYSTATSILPLISFF